MKDETSPKESVSQKVLMGIGAAAVVAVAALLIYFFRASDPASRGPIPYKKFDYGAHMQEQTRQMNRQTAPAPGSSR